MRMHTHRAALALALILGQLLHCGDATQEEPGDSGSLQGDSSGGLRPSDNVLAAISHYGTRAQSAQAEPDDFRHLSTALRFAGRLQECASVVREGARRFPVFATAANMLLLGHH
ncbi:hypothetical protein T484DRAFT_1821277 [Baffinella frigidus]|nr:hypothetical protein T484DRAFT_1821277 [Cryptophyta sp. CCMP2293]